MSPDIRKPCRPWQEIAAEASSEKDAQKLNQLINELNASLDERDGKTETALKKTGTAG